MSDLADRYARRAGLMEATVAAVPADRWSSPSPCEGWSAADLLAHVVESHEMFEGFVGRSLGEIPDPADDPVAAFTMARTAVEGHLRDPDAAAEEFDGVAGRTTFEAACDRFLSFDLVVHRWDIARAAGLDETIPADDVAHITQQAHELAEQFGEAMRSPNAFGPEIAVADDADDQARLLAFLGRQA